MRPSPLFLLSRMDPGASSGASTPDCCRPRVRPPLPARTPPRSFFTRLQPRPADALAACRPLAQQPPPELVGGNPALRALAGARRNRPRSRSCRRPRASATDSGRGRGRPGRRSDSSACRACAGANRDAERRLPASVGADRCAAPAKHSNPSERAGRRPLAAGLSNRRETVLLTPAFQRSLPLASKNQRDAVRPSGAPFDRGGQNCFQ